MLHTISRVRARKLYRILYFGDKILYFRFFISKIIRNFATEILKIMSEVTIKLKLKPFIAQYLTHHFGNPVRFDDHSVTNARIVCVLQRRPAGTPMEQPGDGITEVCIPYSKQKDPDSWNYVSESGKKFIIEQIESIFLNNLWNEMSQMCGDDSKLQSATYAWCEMHGISLDYADTIRMRFYREKTKFLRHGIDLRKKSRSKKNVKF